MKFISLIFISLILTGCSSGYKSFYKPAQGATPQVIAAGRASLPVATPALEHTSDTNADSILSDYAKRGYLMIGSSIFNSGKDESDSSALEQGQSVGADLVLILNPKYTGTVTTTVPITTPTSTTSYTNSNATAYGSGGVVNAYCNSTTTTYGSQTTYIPMAVNRFDYGAVYFVKGRFPLGAFVRDLNDKERSDLESNQGVIVLTTVNNSPAFMANVLPNDIITSIDDTKILNRKHFNDIVKEKSGSKIKLLIIRKSKAIEKEVQLGN